MTYIEDTGDSCGCTTPPRIIKGGPRLAQPRTPSAVSNSTMELEKIIGDTCGLISSLEERLSPVLRSEPESPEKDPGPPCGNVPLANVIAVQIFAASRINRRLERILNLLEL